MRKRFWLAQRVSSLTQFRGEGPFRHMMLNIVSILFPTFAVIALGYVVARRRLPDLAEANRLNMDVFVPCLIFSALARSSYEPRELLPFVGAALLVMVGSGVVGWLLSLAIQADPRTTLPLMIFNNVGNLGIPIALLAFGESALPAAVLLFALSNTLHFSIGVWYLDRSSRVQDMLSVPSVLAALFGFLVSAMQVTLWEPLMTAVEMVGAVSIPLMLFSLGVRLATSRISDVGYGTAVAVVRPVVGGLLALLIVDLLDLTDADRALIVIFGALPPAVLNFILAERYDQEPEKVASAVVMGHAVSVIVIPVALFVAL